MRFLNTSYFLTPTGFFIVARGNAPGNRIYIDLFPEWELQTAFHD